MQIKLRSEISTVVSIAVFLTLMAGCQFVSISGNTQNAPAGGSPNNVDNYQKNSPVESCILHREKARTFRLAGKIQEAADEFQKAIETGCGEIEIHRELAEMYHGFGQFDMAINEYRLLLSLDDTDIRGSRALADIFILDTKNYREGLNEALLAEKLLKKKDYVGRRGLDKQIGQAHDGLGNFSTAIKYYKGYLTGCSETPDSSDCQVIKKRLLELQNKKGINPQ